MTQPPDLFDRKALHLHRARAAKAPVTVLQDEAMQEVSERLSEVNRQFTSPVVIGPTAPIWAEHLQFDTCLCLADDDVLDLKAGAHDLAIHALSLHHMNDPVGQLIQLRRAMRPDGLMLALLYGGGTLQELRSALAEAEVALHGGLSPRVTPMGDLRDLGALLQRAGFALPVADTVPLRLAYPDLATLVRDLRGMGETNCQAARLRSGADRNLFAMAEDIYRRNFADAEGRLLATFELVVLTGWAPASDQPQPLRPGSATARLADALGATEHRMRDD